MIWAHLSFIWKFFFGLSDATAKTTSYTPCSCCIFITILRLLTISCVCIFNYTIFILFCFDHERPEHTLFKNSCTVGSSKEGQGISFWARLTSATYSTQAKIGVTRNRDLYVSRIVTATSGLKCCHQEKVIENLIPGEMNVLMVATFARNQMKNIPNK